VDDLRRGDEVGVDAYVTKPFDPTTLVRTVRDLVEHPAP
jgi:DNA-binding response OmpR family regulator